MMCIRVLGLAALVVGLSGWRADRSEAAFLIATATATGSGSLGGNAFTNVPITLTATADSRDVVPILGGLGLGVNNTSLMISVDGGPSAMALDPTITDGSGLGKVFGIGTGTTDNTGFGIESVSSDAFDTYDLTTAIGPLTGLTLTGSTSPTLATTLGDFHLDSIDPDSGTFQVAFGVSSVPEPSSLALSGIAGVAILAARSRRVRPVATG